MNKTELAKALYEAFEEATRTNGETFYKLATGSPEWMSDAVQAAHAGMLPDDMRYSMIRECARSLADRDADSWEDEAGEIADSLVDVYSMARVRWLASHLGRAAYCDEAQSQGLISEGADIFTRIGIGQYMEYSEILQSLIQSIGEEADNE